MGTDGSPTRIALIWCLQFTICLNSCKIIFYGEKLMKFIDVKKFVQDFFYEKIRPFFQALNRVIGRKIEEYHRIVRKLLY